MLINLKQIVNDMYGNPYPKSFPKTKEDSLEKETVGNVILNSLAIYPIKERKEVFLVNNIANKIIDEKGESIDLSIEQLKFLEDVLYEAVFKENKNGEKNGVYFSYLIGEVLKEVGINN